MIKPLILKLLQRSGYSLVSSQRFERLREIEHYKPADQPFADQVRRVLQKHQVDCVFDVGANDGAFARWLRTEVAFEGHIVSFEPIPHVAAETARLAASDAKWRVLPIALGRTSGIADFHVMASDVFSSFLAPDQHQPERYAESNKIAETVKVTVDTVAGIWSKVSSELGVSRMYLKMDTQGYDLEVFAGALPVAASICALQSELAFQKIYAGSASFEDAFSAFQAGGFKLSMLHPISLDDKLAAIEADGLFVRA